MSVRSDQIILRIRCADAVAGDVAAAVDPIIAAHANVVVRGAFADPNASIEASELAFTVTGEPSDRRYDARARLVARGAWRVLLDALRGELWFRSLADHADVQCSLVSEDGDAFGSTDIETFPYPVSPSTVPFHVSWTEDGPPGRAAIRLFFASPPSADVAEGVAQFFDDWQRLIRAYRPTFEPDVPFGGAAPAAAVRMHPSALELALVGFVADESVFHPVVNFACWLHTHGAAIQELEID